MSPHRREFSARVNSKVECLCAFIDQQIINITGGSYSPRIESEPFSGGTERSIPKGKPFFWLGTQCSVPVIAYGKIKLAFADIGNNVDVLPYIGFKTPNKLPRLPVVKSDNPRIPIDVGAAIVFPNIVGRSDFEVERPTTTFNINPEFD